MTTPADEPADAGAPERVAAEGAAISPAHWVEPQARRPRWAREISAALLTAVVIAALGYPLGLLWGTFAPRVEAVSSTSGALYAGPEQPEKIIGGEGYYLVGTAIAGLGFAVAVWFVWRRFRGPLMLAGLALGAWISGWLIFTIGRDVGRAAADRLSVPTGQSIHFKVPVQLRVQSHGLWHGFLPYTSGVLLTMAITAVGAYIVMTGFSNNPNLKAQPEPAPYWYQPMPDVAEPFAAEASSDSAAPSSDHSSAPAPPEPDEEAPPRD